MNRCLLVLLVGLELIRSSPSSAAEPPGSVQQRQRNRVLIEARIDESAVEPPTTITFSDADGIVVAQQRVSDGRFEIPAAAEAGALQVSFQLKGREMHFDGVELGAFHGRIVVGIDTRPLEDRNLVFFKAKKKPREVWFMDFDPTAGEGTRAVVGIP